MPVGMMMRNSSVNITWVAFRSEIYDEWSKTRSDRLSIFFLFMCVCVKLALRASGFMTEKYETRRRKKIVIFYFSFSLIGDPEIWSSNVRDNFRIFDIFIHTPPLWSLTFLLKLTIKSATAKTVVKIVNINFNILLHYLTFWTAPYKFFLTLW